MPKVVATKALVIEILDDNGVDLETLGRHVYRELSDRGIELQVTELENCAKEISRLLNRW